MEGLSQAISAVGHAAQVAGQLGQQASRLASGFKVPGGMSHAATNALNAAKRLKNSAGLGSIGTKALNAARTFKNAVSSRANPGKIANTASRAASFIGRAAQGAGSKMAQFGSTIKNSFQRYGGWKGARNRAFAPVNVGNQSDPFRVPVTGLEAAMTGKTPQKSVYMPSSGKWFGGRTNKRTLKKKRTKKHRRR